MHRSKPRMLIVEDEPSLARVTCNLFHFFGVQCLTCGTVEAAREHLDIPLDLILLDVVLPDGSGVDVLRAVRSARLRVPVVLWTGLQLGELAEALALKPDQVLHKPAEPGELKALADRMLAEFKPAKKGPS
jgi:two-component system, OmpR family, response regulator